MHAFSCTYQVSQTFTPATRFALCPNATQPPVHKNVLFRLLLAGPCVPNERQGRRSNLCSGMKGVGSAACIHQEPTGICARASNTMPTAMSGIGHATRVRRWCHIWGGLGHGRDRQLQNPRAPRCGYCSGYSGYYFLTPLTLSHGISSTRAAFLNVVLAKEGDLLLDRMSIFASPPFLEPSRRRRGHMPTARIVDTFPERNQLRAVGSPEDGQR